MRDLSRDIIEIAKEMIPLQAISPEAGGDGESRRAEYLASKLKEWGLRPKVYKYVDKTGTARPNVVVESNGSGETITVIAHTDTVVAGDLGEWKTNPFEAVVKNDKIYGRGTEDNGSGVIAGMLALRSVEEAGSHGYKMKLVLAADEEVGSEYGVRPLIQNSVFKSDKMFLVPDWGTKSGSDIEVAEKGRLWLRFTVHGKQTHASTPERGVNAAKEGSRLALSLDAELHRMFAAKSTIFDPPESTFEITKREANVGSINIIPGRDVFHMDMRILPTYSPDSVLKEVRTVMARSKIKASLEVIEKSEPSHMAGPGKSRILTILSGSIMANLGLKARQVGIGGGTVAAYLRKAGKDTAVWAIEDGLAHEPNEYASIGNITREIAVLEGLFA